MDFASFEADRGWLARQRELEDWKLGCARLLEILSDWTGEYTVQFCTAAITRDDPRGDAYRRRLWTCWSYHWREAAGDAQANGARVAMDLRQGRGPSGIEFDGNPLADVVLAEAVLQGESAAWVEFERRFRGLCREQAARYVVAVDRTDSDWWNDLMGHLTVRVPRDDSRPFEPRGALARFRGQNALPAWLRPVARRFFCDRVRSAMSRPAAASPTLMDSSASGPDPAESAVLAEYRTGLRTALASLSEEDQLLVRSGPGRIMTNRQAAALLRRSEGHVSRQREAALTRFRQALTAHLPQGDAADVARVMIDHLEDLLGQPTEATP